MVGLRERWGSQLLSAEARSHVESVEFEPKVFANGRWKLQKLPRDEWPWN